MSSRETDLVYQDVVILQSQPYKGWRCETEKRGYPPSLITLKFTKQMTLEKLDAPIKPTTDSTLIYIGNTQRHPNWQYEAWLRAKSDIDALEG